MAIDSEKLEKYFKLKLAAETGPFGLKAMLDDKTVKVTVLDVRKPEDFKMGHIPGAVNIPSADLELKYKILNKKFRTVVYCYNITCFSATKAALFLAKKGYWSTQLVGGYDSYKQAGLPVENKAPKMPVIEAPKPELVVA